MKFNKNFWAWFFPQICQIKITPEINEKSPAAIFAIKVLVVLFINSLTMWSPNHKTQVTIVPKEIIVLQVFAKKITNCNAN